METEFPGRGVVEVMEQEVLMQREELKHMRAMVAIDESEESFYALQWTLNKLFSFPGVSPSINPDVVGLITLVHVHHVYPVDATRKAQQEKSAAMLSRATQMCIDHMVRVETLILEGNPKHMISDAAEKMNVDLLVVGNRGLGKIKRAFLGSVSDYLAHHARCPVLIVKLPKDQNK